uniref:Uncharacterized protein n=1 Tax=Trypanosoma vivax (strain Y486) TaxID=1055687 RepID=G0TZ46_TRYVY|nr:conserved hypothetical protein [Trypanosoma vivax Y486]
MLRRRSSAAVTPSRQIAALSPARNSIGRIPNYETALHTPLRKTVTTTPSRKPVAEPFSRQSLVDSPVRSRAVITPHRELSKSTRVSANVQRQTPSVSELGQSTTCARRLDSSLSRSTCQRSSLKQSRLSARRGTVGSITAMSSVTAGANNSTGAVYSLAPVQLSANALGGSETRVPTKEEVVRNNALFSISGPYSRVIVVNSSAALWAANDETGSVDIFSSISGEMWARIPARTATKASTRPKTSGSTNAVPTALKAAVHHVWVGYDDGAVAVYDHLCAVAVTTGSFHSSAIVAFCTMPNGITVSGSTDMALVRWDKEEKNFEAITRIVGVPESKQALTCLASFGDNIVMCGSTTGCIVAVDCISGRQAAALRKHSDRVNAIVVIDDLLFSAAEDGVVNVWIMRRDVEEIEMMFQGSCRHLKSISVHIAVRDLVPHIGSRSLWVAYADGVVERWSANPDDDFGVEQVVKEGLYECESSQQQQQREVIGLQCLGTVETMRVLALGSNRVSKVWCGHRNEVEESLQRSIKGINAVITQDSAEAAAWERKANSLKKRELMRKEKYSKLLYKVCTHRLMFTYYFRWRAKIASSLSCRRQHEEICLNLEDRHQFSLRQRYFAMWCAFYDREQRCMRRQMICLALQRLTQRKWTVRLLTRWRECTAFRKLERQREHVVVVLSKLSNARLLLGFFSTWLFFLSERRGTIPVEKLNLLAAKARQGMLRRAYDEWRLAHTRHGVRSAPALLASTTGRRHHIERFAESYEKVTTERQRRNAFGVWRRWYKRRHNIKVLRALACARAAQHSRNIIYRGFFLWQLFVQKRRLVALGEEVKQVEERLRSAEETHVDIFDKLQLQKRLDQLRRQRDHDAQQLQEELARVRVLLDEQDALRQSLSHIGANSCREEAGRGNAMAPTTYAAAPRTLLSPSVLHKLPPGEAMAFVMSCLKGIVLNLYTDMSLFRQIRERLRSGLQASVIFLESFHEVKRLVVNLSKKPVGTTWRSGERWPITPESLEGVKQHPCAVVVQAMKAMVLSYDMVSVSDVESVSSTREEIIENADLLFMLWRACYSARKPLLPANNRIATR